MTANERAVPHYLLYGSRASYYTMKVFAYLRYKGLPFDLAKVTDQIAEDVIKPLTGGWRVVPVLYGPDSGYVQDSSLILVTTTNEECNTNCQRKSSTTTGKNIRQSRWTCAFFDMYSVSLNSNAQTLGESSPFRRSQAGKQYRRSSTRF